MLDTYISDHKTNCIDLDLPKPTVHKTTFSVINLKKIDIFEFNKDIAAALTSVVNLDLDSLVQFLNSTLTLILDKQAPLKTVTVTQGFHSVNKIILFSFFFVFNCIF